MDVMGSLQTFINKVVRMSKESRLLSRARWIREDQQSYPQKWFRPDFVPPSPCLVRDAGSDPVTVLEC